MFDTHCHLNFKAFKKKLDQVIKRAEKAGVKKIVVPGTNLKTSKKAVELAEKHPFLYPAVGIHPHHVYQIKNKELRIKKLIKEIEGLLDHKKVVAVGEIGLDYHIYTNTKYENYQLDNDFKNQQKDLLKKQIKLAIKYNKSLIIHNREAVDDILLILEKNLNKKLLGKTVFHCCEPNNRLLDFAVKNHVYIGVDGDITYNKKKQQFIKKVPLDLLVIETDSPFLLPEPLKSQKKYPNEPSNLSVIAGFVSKILKVSNKKFVSVTKKNSLKLFNIKTPLE